MYVRTIPRRPSVGSTVSALTLNSSATQKTGGISPKTGVISPTSRPVVPMAVTATGQVVPASGQERRNPSFTYEAAENLPHGNTFAVSENTSTSRRVVMLPYKSSAASRISVKSKDAFHRSQTPTTRNTADERYHRERSSPLTPTNDDPDMDEDRSTATANSYSSKKSYASNSRARIHRPKRMTSGQYGSPQRTIAHSSLRPVVEPKIVSPTPTLHRVQSTAPKTKDHVHAFSASPSRSHHRLVQHPPTSGSAGATVPLVTPKPPRRLHRRRPSVGGTSVDSNSPSLMTMSDNSNTSSQETAMPEDDDNASISSQSISVHLPVLRPARPPSTVVRQPSIAPCRSTDASHDAMVVPSFSLSSLSPSTTFSSQDNGAIEHAETAPALRVGTIPVSPQIRVAVPPKAQNQAAAARCCPNCQSARAELARQKQETRRLQKMVQDLVALLAKNQAVAATNA